MNHTELSQPKPKRLFRWRILLALLVSVILHLVLIPEITFYDHIVTPNVIQARLTSATPTRADNEDSRGEREAIDQTTQAASAQKTFISPNPPKTQSAAPVTPPPPLETASRPKQPPQPKQPSVTKQVKAPAEPVTTKKIPEPESAPEPASETRKELTQRAKYQGAQETFSNPIEQAYYETLMAHLNRRLPNHPDGIEGRVRLQVKIQYNAIITSVTIIESSENTPTDDWAIRALLSVSPVPPVPAELKQPYYFRPTLILTD